MCHRDDVSEGVLLSPGHVLSHPHNQKKWCHHQRIQLNTRLRRTSPPGPYAATATEPPHLAHSGGVRSLKLLCEKVVLFLLRKRKLVFNLRFCPDRLAKLFRFISCVCGSRESKLHQQATKRKQIGFFSESIRQPIEREKTPN